MFLKLMERTSLFSSGIGLSATNKYERSSQFTVLKKTDVKRKQGGQIVGSK